MNFVVGAGFDPNSIADLIAQFGDDVVQLVSDAIRSGFSRQFVLDTLLKFGPWLLKFLLDMFSKKQEAAVKMGVAADTLSNAVVEANLIETFLERMLPKILEKYGERLIDSFIELIMSYIETK